MINHLEELMQQHINFTFATFPEATAQSSLIKLVGEIQELKEELHYPRTIKNDNERLAEEYIDCIMCLTDSAARAGISPNQLHEAFAKKLDKNAKRKWIKNPDNTYSHIKL